MDKRLVGQFGSAIWESGGPKPLDLCMYAVVLARIDRETETATASDEYLNQYLGDVLAMGFHPLGIPEVLAGDYQGLMNRLNAPAHPIRRVWIAQSIGDRLLYFTSQASRVGRTKVYGLSLKAMIGVGQLAYAMAAAHSLAEKHTTRREIYSRLADEWPDFQALLYTAGEILGFNHELPDLIASGQQVTTLEGFLEVLGKFRKAPSPETWDALADIVRRRERTDAGFHYKLPPCPQA